MTESLKAIAERVGAEVRFEPCIEFANVFQLQEFADELRASLPSNPEHDTYGAPPVGALTGFVHPSSLERARQAVYGHYGADTTEVNVGVLCELIALAHEVIAQSSAPSEAVKGVSDNPADENYLCPAGRAQRGLPPFTAVKGVSTAEPEGHDHEWRAHPVTKAMICRYCGIDRSPAVAVQADPKAMADDLIEANPYPTYTFVAQNAAVEKDRAERYARTLLRTALAAHPKPAGEKQ